MHILYIISSQIHTSAGGMEELQDSLLHVTQQLLAPLVLLPILVNSAEAILVVPGGLFFVSSM